MLHTTLHSAAAVVTATYRRAQDQPVVAAAAAAEEPVHIQKYVEYGSGIISDKCIEDMIDGPAAQAQAYLLNYDLTRGTERIEYNSL